MPEPDPVPPSDSAPTDAAQRLLALQALDLESDELRRRRAALPARAEVAEIEAAAAELERRSRQLAAGRQQHAEHEQRLAADAGELAQRIALIESRSRSGTVDYRDQEALASELAALVRRRDELEDEELGELTELDRLEADSQRLEAERPLLVARHRAALDELARAERGIDDQLAELDRRRPPLASALEPRLLAEYERLRQRLGGEVVAPVVRGACSGCHLSLSASEADRLRHSPPGTLARCEQCGRILIG